MKRSIKYLLALGFGATGLIATGALTSCSSKTSNIEGDLSVNPTAETLEITATVKDPDSVINSGSVIVRYWEYDDNDTPDDTSDDTKSSVSTIKFSDLPGTDDDGNPTSETETATGLDSNQDYLLQLYCTVGTDEYVIKEEHYSTNAKGKTEDNPIEITTADELYNMDEDLDAYYVLSNDIDLTDWTSDDKGSPIFSTSSKAFTGQLKGNGHKITGFAETTSVTYSGFFGYIGEGAQISDLTIESPTITFSRGSESYVGAFAGYNQGEITNCFVTGASLTITCTSSSGAIADIGGFVGYNAAGAKIINSGFSGTITCEFKSIVTLGGFVGVDLGKSMVNNTSEATIKVTSTSSSSSVEDVGFNCGGFVGIASGRITACKSIGSIDATYSFSSSNTSIDKTYASNMGGFAGTYNTGIIKGCVSNMNLSYTSNTSYQSLYTNFGLLVGNVGTGLNADGFANNVVIGQGNTITLALLDSNGAYNYERNVVVDSETTTETTDRIFNFGFFNSLDEDYKATFYQNGLYSVVGNFTVTNDAQDYVTTPYSNGSAYTTLTLETYIVSYIQSILA